MDNDLQRHGLTMALVIILLGAGCSPEQRVGSSDNPFFAPLNEPVAYGEVTADHVSDYAQTVMEQAAVSAEAIRTAEAPKFDNVVAAYDEVMSEMEKAASNSWMLYWVSPDSLTRVAGLAAFHRLDSLSTVLASDKAIYDQIAAVAQSEALAGVREKLVFDLVRNMKHSGVDLEAADLDRYRALTAEINDLTSQYSTNMNTATPTLVLDEAGVRGLPDNLKSRYATGEGTYKIPVIAVNNRPVLDNAVEEQTRRAYATAYANRAADENLAILDQLVANRHELGRIMGHSSYADYSLELNMAQNPDNVWRFLDDLIDRTKGKAAEDLVRLKEVRRAVAGTPHDVQMNPWDLGYYRNTLLKNEFQVDAEEIREYLPLERALEGMMELYQELLGFEFRRVENASVWHEEVEMFEVYEEGTLAGRFYLDLFPRPNKESWFYGVSLTPGHKSPNGYEVPVWMLLGNFTRPTADLPSLVSHGELGFLFHEFGHIVAGMSYKGEFMLQSESRPDFGEAMSQIFENWTWNYDVLSLFATHYETGGVLPQETFENMLAAKNVTSGLDAQRGLQLAVYDMVLYNRHDPENPMPTDDIWRSIADRFVFWDFIEGTHPQASWIHINTHPVYYYGYLWSRVYAEDMFTQFEDNGLRDTETGKRYRQLILANGTQRAIEEVVEDFLGRPTNNEAYVRSLGLESGLRR